MMTRNFAIAIGLTLSMWLNGLAESHEPGLYEDEFTERPLQSPKAVVDGDKPKAERKPAKKTRRCIRCGGKGKIISASRQTCEQCGGSGILTKEVELKDSVNGRPWWQGNYKTTRKSRNSQPCPYCNRSGRAMVKKEVECSLCKGTGEMP